MHDGGRVEAYDSGHKPRKLAKIDEALKLYLEIEDSSDQMWHIISHELKVSVVERDNWEKQYQNLAARASNFNSQYINKALEIAKKAIECVKR